MALFLLEDRVVVDMLLGRLFFIEEAIKEWEVYDSE
jgi:hypothetical protein